MASEEVRESVAYEDIKRREWTLSEEEAREYVQSATSDLATMVRSTLGPEAMEKLIQTESLKGEPEHVATSDAAEILAAIERGNGFTHPVAALTVDYIDSLQRGLADGSTTAILLTHELVHQGFDLVEQGLHPGNVVVGYGLARSRAGSTLDSLAEGVSADDTEQLASIAATSMTASINPKMRERYSQLVAKAIRRLARNSDDWIDAEAVRPLVSKTLDEGIFPGVIVHREPAPVRSADDTLFGESPNDMYPDILLPESVENATVAFIEQEIKLGETATTSGQNTSTSISIDSAESARAYSDGRRDYAEKLAEDLQALGIDVLVSQPEITDQEVLRAMTKAGIGVVDNVKYPKSDLYRLADATGGSVVATLEDIRPEVLGETQWVENKQGKGESWTLFKTNRGPASTLVLNANTVTAENRIERLVEDALQVSVTAILDGQILPGAGAPAMAIAADLRDYAPTVADREQLAIEAFVDSLEKLVRTLAKNTGNHPVESLNALRASHVNADEKPAPVGLDVTTGDPVNAFDAGVLEPRRIFSQAIETSGDAAERLIGTDAVFFPGVDFTSFTPQTEHD